MDFITLEGESVIEFECELDENINCSEPVQVRKNEMKYFEYDPNPKEEYSEIITVRRKCGEIFIDDNDLFSFFCTLCENSFEETEKLLTHVRNEHSKTKQEQESFKNGCNDATESKEDVYKDSTSEDGDIPSNMEKCFQEQDFLSMNKNNEILPGVEQNLESTKETIDHLSTISNDDVKEENMKSRKRKLIRDDIKDVEEKPECDICGKIFSSQRSLNRHKSVVNCINRISFTCELCGKIFSDRKYLKKHKLFTQRGHDPKKVAEMQAELLESKSVKYISKKCKYCGKLFSDRGLLNEHERIHTGERPFQCDVCGSQFRTKATYDAHEKSHKDEKEYKCGICFAAFNTRTSFYIHKKRHGEKNWKCRYCSKSFFENMERVIHERVHTGEKPHKCKFCEQSFTTLGSLGLHHKKHLNIRKHKCEHCDKKFFSKEELKSHVVYHTGERPFVCTVCNATFQQRTGLITHKRIHSEERNCICKICGKAFKQYAGLYMHKKTHLKDNLQKS